MNYNYNDNDNDNLSSLSIGHTIKLRCRTDVIAWQLQVLRYQTFYLATIAWFVCHVLKTFATQSQIENCWSLVHDKAGNRETGC